MSLGSETTYAAFCEDERMPGARWRSATPRSASAPDASTKKAPPRMGGALESMKHQSTVGRKTAL